ncbi:MAG: ABC transporter permease [Tepidanaerobacteraceae bacterium]|nr:ABC transporter permease [Thermoanaerobacterales bacterium]
MKGIKILERLLATIPVVLGIAIIVFLFMRLTPGDPVDIMMGKAGMVTEAEIQALQEEFNLNEPLHIQLLLFFKGLFSGDLGNSITRGVPVIKLIKETLPATIELAMGALVVALIIALPIGIISAVKQNSIIDRVAMAGSFVGISMPGFWLGIVLIILFSVNLNWLPSQGRLSHLIYLEHITGLYVIDAILTGNTPALIDALKHLLLPSITLGASMAAIIARVMRSSMLEVLKQDYVMLARSKGLSQWLVVVRHCIKNAMMPTITVVGMQVGVLLGGNMITESVFGWPGLGRLVVDAIFNRDYPLVQGVVMFYALTFVIANFLVDVIYTYINPKIEL